MSKILLACCVVVVGAAIASASQTEKAKVPKKGDTVVVKGCLRGNAVESAEIMSVGAEGEKRPEDEVPTLTYRLQGSKDLLKELRDKHDRKIVEVKGVLRSELGGSGIGRDVGRTRITIGVDPRTGRSPQGSDRAVPVLEATSFEASTVSCGR
jgi:hypothetical protein